MTSYDYTQIDFKNTTQIDIIDLQNTINNSSILSAQVQYINYSEGPKNTFSVEIFFNQALSDEDQILLGGIVENYIYVSYSNISARITDSRTAGTNGGDFIAGQWNTRDLNTIAGSQNFCTLKSNQFTLIAGIYHAEISAAAFGVENHQIRLRDVTNNITVAVSPNGYTTFSNDLLNISTTVNIADVTTFEVQHQCSKTVKCDGYGRGCGFGENEIYCQVVIQNNTY